MTKGNPLGGEVPVLLLDGTWIWGAAASATAFAWRD